MSFRLNNASDLERLLVRAKRAAVQLDVEQMHVCASLLNDALPFLTKLSIQERKDLRMTLLRYRDVCAFVNETLEEILNQGQGGFQEKFAYGQAGRLKDQRKSPAMMMEGYS
tara:strand:- start:238 stop:573 length:336 start_codon:yes stop_codon:yes gene_type:complete